MDPQLLKKVVQDMYGVTPPVDSQPPPLEAEGAVDTSGGINAALSISPSEAQQNVRKAILNPVQMGNPDGMTAMSSSDDSWKDALAGTLNDYGMGDAVDLYGNAKVGPQRQAEPPTLAEDPNAKLREQMMEREATRSALRPLDGDAESGLVRATFMLNAASKHSQGDVMSAWQLSQKLDMPFEVTLDNLAAARLAGSEIVPDDIKSFAPAFLRLVQYDYDAAILWRHDLATANAVAEAFSPVDAVADTFVPMPNDDFDHDTRGAAIGRGVAKGGLGIAQALFTLGKAGIEGLGQAEGLGQRMAEGIASTIKPEALLLDKPVTETPAVSQWLGDMAQAATKAMGDISEDAPYAGKAIWDNPEVMLDSRWWLENGISTAMSSLPAMAAYAAKGGLAAGATGFVMEAANAYNDMIADGLPDDFRTRAYAAVYGVVAGALEATGTASMFGGIPAVKAAFKNMLTGAAEGGVKQAVKHSAVHVGMGFLGEGGTEWLQNIAQGGLESAAKGNTGEQIFNDVLASAKELENLVLGGVFGGAMAGVHSRAEVRGERFNADIAESVRRAANAPEMVAAREEIEAITRESGAAQSRMAFAQSLEKAAAAADSSTMHQADPALFEQEAANLIPEEARTVWLDVATVQEFTRGDPARLEALGLTQQNIDEAVSTGASGVQVPTMAIVSRFQGEERQTLMQSARSELGGMTQEEAQSFDPAARSEEAANRIRSVSQTSAEVNKEKTRLKQEFVQAGYPAHMAEYYATLHAAQARAFADRYGLDPVLLLRQRSVVQGNPEEVPAGALHHPLNAGVNLESRVRVVTVQPQFEGKRLWEMLKGKGRNALRASITGVYTNRDTGWMVKVTANGAEHAISSASKRGIGGMEHVEAVANLPELIESAALIESHSDNKKQGLAAVHRMYAPMASGKDMYAVKLTVKESPEGMVAEIEDVRKLYDLSLEKKMPGDLRPPPVTKGTLAGSANSNPGISKITLRRLLEGVKDHKGNRFFQPADTAGDNHNDQGVQNQGPVQKKDLVAAHNLSEQNLQFADKIGGLPVPSIGITKAATPFDGFGNITLIGHKDMVDPSRGVPVFSADAYSARFPEVLWPKVKTKDAQKFMNESRPYFDEFKDGSTSNVWDSLVNSPSRDRALEDFTRGRMLGARAMYADQVLGKKVGAPMRYVPHEYPFIDKQLIKEAKNLQFSDIEPGRGNSSAMFTEAVKQAVERWAGQKATEKGRPPESIVLLGDAYLGRLIKDGELTYSGADSVLRDIRRAGEKEVDVAAAEKRLDALVPKEDPAFLKWAADKIGSMFGDPSIKVGGRKVPMSLENLVDAMSTRNVRGKEETMTFGGGRLAAEASKRFKFIEEIQAERDRVVSPDEHNASVKSADANLEAYRTSVLAFFTQKDYRGDIDTWAGLDASMKALADAVKKGGGEQSIRSALTRNGFKGVNARTVSLAKQALDSVKQAKVDYFEAKPQRGVKLNEFMGAVIPAKTSPEARAILEKNGLRIAEYDGTPEGRAKALDSLSSDLEQLRPGVLFQHAYSQQRGAVSFGASGDSITSIFKDASDPSTPIHEGAHVFINDLIRVVADDGRMLEADFHQRISANNADAKAGTIDEKLRKHRERAITQNYETRRRNIHWTARGDLEALVANANAQREAHGKAIGEDLVEVPLEAALNGSLTPEQIKTLQEVNATGFEAYVREGNAPSDALRGAFHRMKEWLKAIYRALTVNGVQPTPEVARVFDRMLATDAAIDSSKAGAAMSNEAEFFEAINGLGDDVSVEWSKKDRINYKAALNKEGDEFQRLHELYNLAEAEVSARMDKEALKERNQRWKGYYAEGKEIAQGDVFYDVIAALTAKTDVSFSGISREWLERMYGKGAVADLRKTAMGRKIINSEGGMPLDAVGIADIVGNSDRAEAMGLSDADGLYNYLYDNIVVRQRSLTRDAKAYADQRLADDDRQAEKTADVPGEAYRKYLDEVEATVLRMAAREGAAWRTPEQQARWIEQNRLTLATVRRQVREVLRGKPLRDIMPNMYVGEVRAALQDRNAALLAGNARDALAAVDRARTALESWIEANRIIKEREAFEKQAARLAVVKRDVIAPEAYTAIQDLLERFQTVPKRAFRDAPKPLQEVVDNLAAASGAVQSGPAVAEWLLTSAQEVNYKDLNVEQLQDVKDLLAMLERTGRDVLASNKASEAAKVKEVADAGADSMAGLKPDILAAAGSALRGWQDWSRKFFSSFAAIQWQMRQADGFTNVGPKGKRGVNEMRIYGAIVEGESRREIRMRALTDRLAPVFQRLAESAKRMEKEKGKAFMGANNKPLAVPESMRQISRNNWTADNVIAMALNLGNEGNTARLREGFPDLKPEVLAQLLGDDAARLVFKNWAGKGHEGLLSAKDWRDIQEIWDTLHTQWADIRATHERMYGFKPRGVEAREITLSIGGKAIMLPGGYYPAVYDPQLSKEVAGRNEKQDALARGEAIYAVPAARKGFTQGRANSGGGLPLMLSTGVVMSHLNDVTRFIELAETGRFADRVTQSPQWAQAYTAAFGKAQYDAIRPNLKNIVLEDRPPMDAFSIAAEKARAHLIPWGLGWNFKTALLQSTALFPAMNDLGAGNVMRGVSALGIGRYALVKEIWENSSYMKSRASNIDQDLRQAVKSINERTRQKAVKLLGAEVTWDKVVEAGMLPLLTVDMATSSAIWLAAYNKEMVSLMGGPAGKRGIDPSSEYHKAAVLSADMTVKAVNPDFNPSSRSAFLRDRGVVRLLNMFSSAVVLFAQRRAYNFEALKQAWYRAGKDKTARLSAVGSYARYEAYDFLLPAVAMGLLQSLAGGSDDPDKWGKNVRSAYLDSFAMRLPVAGGVISSLITNETWRGMSTVFEQPVRMGQRLAGAIHQGNEEKMVGAMADALSFLTKIPVSRVAHSGMRGYDQWQRGEGTPLSLVMPSPGK